MTAPNTFNLFVGGGRMIKNYLKVALRNLRKHTGITKTLTGPFALPPIGRTRGFPHPPGI